MGPCKGYGVKGYGIGICLLKPDYKQLLKMQMYLRIIIMSLTASVLRVVEQGEFLLVDISGHSVADQWHQSGNSRVAGNRTLHGLSAHSAYYHGTDMISAMQIAETGFQMSALRTHNPMGVYAYCDEMISQDSMYNDGAVIVFESIGIIVSERVSKEMQIVFPGIIART